MCQNLSHPEKLWSFFFSIRILIARTLFYFSSDDVSLNSFFLMNLFSTRNSGFEWLLQSRLLQQNNILKVFLPFDVKSRLTRRCGLSRSWGCQNSYFIARFDPLKPIHQKTPLSVISADLIFLPNQSEIENALIHVLLKMDFLSENKLLPLKNL